MKNIPFIILVIFMLSFTMCKQETRIKKEDNVIQVDLDNPEKASLFDYFRSIELIPLETSPDVLVKGFTKMVVHQGNYYALDKPQSIILPSIQQVNVFLRSIKKGKVSESIHLLKILSLTLITVILSYWNLTEKYIGLIYLGTM